MKITKKQLIKIIQKTISEAAIQQNQYEKKDVINFLKILKMANSNPYDTEQSVNQAISLLSSLFNIECNFTFTGGPDYYYVWFFCDDTRLLELIDATSAIEYDVNEYGSIVPTPKDEFEPVSNVEQRLSCKDSFSLRIMARYSPPKT